MIHSEAKAYERRPAWTLDLHQESQEKSDRGISASGVETLKQLRDRMSLKFTNNNRKYIWVVRAEGIRIKVGLELDVVWYLVTEILEVE